MEAVRNLTVRKSREPRNYSLYSTKKGLDYKVMYFSFKLTLFFFGPINSTVILFATCKKPGSSNSNFHTKRILDFS